MMQRTSSVAIYVLATVAGLIAFTYPLFLGVVTAADPFDAAGSTVTPIGGTALLTSLLLLIGLGALLIEVQGQAVNAKVLAAMGLLVAIASVLRFLETAIPGPGGFSPVFVPIILAGYVYGARFGFLMGTMTMITSALITGGIGPWLPYQMIAAGWVGMSAGWLPHPDRRRLELALLTGFAIFWGLFFGFILNLYFWPFIAGEVKLATTDSAGLPGIFARYGAFYLTTSLVWDIARGLGNGLMMLAIGIPAVKALSRFRDRLRFEIV
ncbi:MAG TPA: ECF transporter S component [Patescibacteria group bacterium]|jgi:energy-coupling factor transport system substrate-specific component|nr:ECF transporter S component [Patescibacteria group bacterium]